VRGGAHLLRHRSEIKEGTKRRGVSSLQLFVSFEDFKISHAPPKRDNASVSDASVILPKPHACESQLFDEYCKAGGRGKNSCRFALFAIRIFCRPATCLGPRGLVRGLHQVLSSAWPASDEQRGLQRRMHFASQTLALSAEAQDLSETKYQGRSSRGAVALVSSALSPSRVCRSSSRGRDSINSNSFVSASPG
jgi:hypothetical protein